VGVFLLLVGALELTAPDCPSAAAIAAEWARLGVAAPAGSASVVVEDEWLHLTLRDAWGALRADRRLRAPQGCADRAQVAALVLAAWSPPPAAAPHVPQLGDAETPNTAVVRRAPPLPSTFVEVSASFVGAIDPAGFAPGGLAEVAFAPRQQAWWGVLSLAGSGARTFSAGGSEARYTRAYASLGARRRFAVSAWRFDLEADTSFALTWIDGVNLATQRHGYAFDFGLGGGLRVGRRVGAFTPFLSARVVGWVTRQTVVTLGDPFRADLPRVDGLFSTGVAWNR
jgi:hypothetical protein